MTPGGLLMWFVVALVALVFLLRSPRKAAGVARCVAAMRDGLR